MPAHNTLYKWVLHTGLHHCPRCYQMAGQIRTAAEWDVTERPALHTGCLCELLPCNGIGELITAPPYTPPSHHIGAKGEGPGKGSKSGDRGDGKGKGETGDKGEGAGKGSKASAPANQDDSLTEKPNSPKADDLTPSPPDDTPPATLPNKWQ
jgi:hypothetical protein